MSLLCFVEFVYHLFNSTRRLIFLLNFLIQWHCTCGKAGNRGGTPLLRAGNQFFPVFSFFSIFSAPSIAALITGWLNPLHSFSKFFTSLGFNSVFLFCATCSFISFSIIAGRFLRGFIARLSPIFTKVFIMLSLM